MKKRLKFFLFFTMFLLMLSFSEASISSKAILDQYLTGKASSSPLEMSINIVMAPPFLAVHSPLANTYLYKNNILINYTTTSLTDYVNYSIDSSQNITISSTSFYINTTEGEHTLKVYASRDGYLTTRTINFIANTTKLSIIYNEYNGTAKGNSTNFIVYTYEQLQNLSNIIIENANHGKIAFSGAINVTNDANPTDNIIDINSNVNISFNRIEIIETALPNFNASATLTLRNLTFSNPKILRNSQVCPASVCKNQSYLSGTLIFNVTGFSTYSTEETTSETNETAEETAVATTGRGSTGGTKILFPKYLTDINTRILDEYKIIYPGGKILMEIVIQNLGTEEIKDAKIRYCVETADKNIIKCSEETVAIYTKIQLIKEFLISSDTSPGEYFIKTEIRYDNTTSTSETSFEVKSNEVAPQQNLTIKYVLFIILGIVILILLILIILIIWTKKRMRQEKKQARKLLVKALYQYLCALFFLLIVFIVIYWSPKMSGFVIEKQTEPIGIIFDNSTIYSWQTAEPGILHSLALSGYIEGNGSAKVYFENLLVIDTANLSDKKKPKKIHFNKICEETCNIEHLNLNKSNYSLTIEISNSKLFISKIDYIINITPEENHENNSGLNVVFMPPTPENNYFSNKNFITINVESANSTLSNITLSFFNSSSLINKTISLSNNLLVNFTDLEDEIYLFNATAKDSANNENSTETRKITIDTTPPQITISSPKNTTLLSRNYIINITLNEEGYCEYSLNNGLINETLSNNENIRFIAERIEQADGNYMLNIYCRDILENRNESESVSFRIETPVSCVENWTAEYTSCNISNQKTKYYIDTNSCGTINNLPLYNGTTESCDYCSSAWENLNSSCQIDDSFIVGYIYINSCCAETGLISDCNMPTNTTIACDYCPPNLTSANSTCQSDNTLTETFTDLNNCYSSTNLESDRITGQIIHNCTYIAPSFSSSGGRGGKKSSQQNPANPSTINAEPNAEPIASSEENENAENIGPKITENTQQTTAPGITGRAIAVLNERKAVLVTILIAIFLATHIILNIRESKAQNKITKPNLSSQKFQTAKQIIQDKN